MRGNFGYGYPGSAWGGQALNGAAMYGAVGFPWIPVISWIVGIAIVVALVYIAIRLTRKTASGGDEALGILAARFARGEISKEEYVEAKDFLKKN